MRILQISPFALAPMVQRWAEVQFGDTETPAPIRLRPGQKLLILRRLDLHAVWESLDDERKCLRCGCVFTGRQVDVVGGTRERGPLRLLCPTEGCSSTPEDWIRPGRTNGVAQGATAERQPLRPRVVRIVRKRMIRSKPAKARLAPLDLKPLIHPGLAQRIARLLHPERPTP